MGPWRFAALPLGSPGSPRNGRFGYAATFWIQGSRVVRVEGLRYEGLRSSEFGVWRFEIEDFGLVRSCIMVTEKT